MFLKNDSEDYRHILKSNQSLVNYTLDEAEHCKYV